MNHGKVVLSDKYELKYLNRCNEQALAEIKEVLAKEGYNSIEKYLEPFEKEIIERKKL